MPYIVSPLLRRSVRIRGCAHIRDIYIYISIKVSPAHTALKRHRDRFPRRHAEGEGVPVEMVQDWTRETEDENKRSNNGNFTNARHGDDDNDEKEEEK